MFCSECGSQLPHSPPVKCPSCGSGHWLNAKPAACALVTQDSKLLLIRRATEPWLGSWDIPGGFCEQNEHPLLAAEREVLEETGLHIRITGFLGIWLDSYSDKQDERAETTMNVFYHGVPLDGGQGARPSEEASEVSWFGPDELPVDIAFPASQLPALAAWRESLAQRQTVTPLIDRP
jgi:8-oxo-dGTP diphosphatase